MPFRHLSQAFERVAIVVVLAGMVACGDTSGPGAAPGDEADYDEALRNRISISGVSSGAYLAIQTHIAFADRVGSVAAIAGGPYHCAEGDVQTALARCMTGDGLDIEPLIEYTTDFASAGTIASLDKIAASRVWIFHSPADTVVSPSAGVALRDFYTDFVDESAVVFVDDVEAAHGWVTVDAGLACNELGGDFINACDYDAAGALLHHAYGELKPRGKSIEQNLVLLDVSGYFESDSDVADQAFAYIPSSCENSDSGCRLHVALHGCVQGSEFIEDRFVTQAGLNEWAETNDIVVVYPQLEKSMFNPKGCWDWWGYTGDDYDQRSGSQVAGIGALIEAFASGTLPVNHADP
jgi:poly(3-hydroxybutyrate) depolymerase